jgi:microcin C transport system permease protein
MRSLQLRVDSGLMRDYFLRRLLLIPPTLIGVTIIVFAITRFVPGGPLERAIMEMQMMGTDGGASSGMVSGQGMAISDDQLELLKEYYGFDKPVLESYVVWLGKVARGDLGESYRYNEPVLDVISERFPISLYYGIVTLIITYAVCIPLGILKAIRHKTVVDTVTSMLIFTGYAIPGYALGSLLLLLFSVKLDWFPMGGFVSYDFADLTLGEQIVDLMQHSVLPLICYLIGSFALVTLLLKNHLMDNLAADYMRTAIAKGVSFRAEYYVAGVRLVPDRDHLRYRRFRLARTDVHYRQGLSRGHGRRVAGQFSATRGQYHLGFSRGARRSENPVSLSWARLDEISPQSADCEEDTPIPGDKTRLLLFYRISGPARHYRFRRIARE